MQKEKQFLFGTFRLDMVSECLWHGDEAIRLPPKAYALLCCLVTHPGQLMTKETLFETVWPQVSVTDGVLSVCIAQIRKALGDDSKRAQFIETVHRRGYRFIAPINTGPQPASGIEASIRATLRKAATTIGSLPLVGRDTELSVLQDKLDLTLQGKGGVVFITGPAGIGKTRLVRELRNRAKQRGFNWLAGQYEKAGSHPYRAWLEMVNKYLHQKDDTSLQKLVGPYAGQLAKLVPEVAKESEGVTEALPNDPEGERVRLFEGLTRFFVHASHEAPLVLFLDDLQWAPSIELLHRVARNVGDQRVMMLVAYRDDELKESHDLWQTVLAMNRERLFHPLSLKPLNQGEVEQLISCTVEGTIAPRLLEVIYQKTEGNPFFVEEVLRLLQERNAIVCTEAGWEVKETVSVETPESVKAVINERLGRLGKGAEELLRIASVIGREFSLRVLRELVDEKEEAFIEALDRSEAAGLISSLRLPGEGYSFAHDLVQEALYESIGPARRQRHHRRVGQAMERLYAGRLEDRYEALAHHFLEGNDLEKTASYSWQAGKKAAAQFAYGNALAYFERALGALGHLPETRETLEQAVAILIDLGPALRTIKKTSAPEVEQTYTQARELCRRLGDTPLLFPVLWGLCRTYHSRGELHKSRELGEQLVSLAQSIQDPALILEAHHTLWTTSCGLGEFFAANEHCGRGRALYDPKQHRQLAFLYGGHDPGVCCGTHGARALWFLGYPDQALERSQETIFLGRELSHPFSLAFALCWAALVHQFRGEWEAVQELTEEAIILAAEHGFPRWLMLGPVLRGWVSVNEGNVEQGIRQIRQGLASEGNADDQQIARALLAEAYGKAGKPEQGFGVVAEALARAHKTGLCFYAAELHRIKGELLLQQAVPAEAHAQACFQSALEVSRQQKAKSLELRAAMSLSRLWQKESKQKEARHLLDAIYGWFTEGFETADLKEAKALLNEWLDCAPLTGEKT